MVRRRRSFFDIFDEMFREIEELFEEEFERLEKMAREAGGKVREVRGPYIYGVRITFGPEGPKIEEFGNIRREGLRPRIAEEREPLVDVFEEDGKLVVIAELPGVDKEKIDIKATENKLVIRASNDYRKYYKEIELPKPVKPETAKAQYRNGVLEVKIDLKEKSEEGVKVKVE